MDPKLEADIVELVERRMDELDLRAAIVRVTIDGEEVTTFARGESLTGVPATTDMHFRNGAVAISYVATLLLTLVDEGRAGLDDTVATWLPEIPYGEQVTLGQLAQMTSGYPDYVIGNEAFGALLYDDPFRQWRPEELLALIADAPLFYEPGSNWNYAHTNYVILGLVLEEILGQPIADAMDERILGPLGLSNTTDPGTAAIPEPVLHAFSSERRDHLGVSAGTPFYEETTFWNPSWTITHGAIQTTNIHDLNTTARAISNGVLLSPESHQLMVSTDLRGFGSPIEGCPTCFEQSVGYSYGLGIITTGNWLAQNPMFAGEAAAFGYLPSRDVAIAVAVTFSEEAFDEDGNPPPNRADSLWREIGELIVPDDAPPIRR
ncbi:MAG: beta-lactamase family protein [Halioglobus sp.]|nr:beta-lactamase family protein [Halioglobus sp.]